MQTLHLIADNNDEGIRLDAFLAQKSGETRSRIQNLIKDGCVRRNGKAPGKAGEKLTAGDEIELTLPDPEPLEAVPVEMDIPIVYEDADIVVVNKPRALVVHPAAGHQQDTLVNALLFACDDLSGIGGKAPATGWIRIPRGLWWWPRTMPRTSIWRSRSASTAQGASIGRWSKDIFGTTRALWMPPSAAAPRTAKRWRLYPAAGKRAPITACWNALPDAP